MAPARLSEIANALLTLGCPIGWNKIADLSQWLELKPGSRLLDLGAGKGEVSIRLAESYGCGGVALEHRQNLCGELETTLSQRGLKGITVVCADAGNWLQTQPEACFDAILCLGASGALGGYSACLQQLGHWLAPGGCLLMGEGYWQQEPAAEYLEMTGIPRAEMGWHVDNVETARALGWEYLMAYTASLEEWDAFEGRYHLAVRQHLRAYPDDPDAAALDRAISDWHLAYLRHGRQTLGFGLYLLRKGA
ncbi:MAG TPA: methyltransferase domain-containing protein [Candidatus Obscuribacterales bacterium]